ncbi:hypothetical protein [Polaribacter sp. AHE13PA]|uniref:hypothetical protein n=1 Tax=Polaribacter sp. AHE13PA TaxID=2745562 RepID=UPI001C4F76E8|nr:hypothetical protein [Polaribacter sp. AHE13PA]QXP66422.1 hypothetical protein H0I28_14765 [Polaribacter sp. AHE13PA]
MEKDYISIYTKAYQEGEIHHEKYIKKKVLEYHDYLYFHDNNNLLINELEIKLSDNIIFEDTLREVTKMFLGTRFGKGHELRIITIKLLPEFLKIDKGDLKVSFEVYLKELARFKAEEEIQRLFCNNKDSYRLMFELKDFSEFSIKGCDGVSGSVLYEKLRRRHYGISDNEDLKSNNYEQELNLLNENGDVKRFSLSKKHKEIFFDKNFYNHLTSYYVSQEYTKFEDLKNVFFKDFNSNKSFIVFDCEDVEALYFLYYLAKKLKKNVTQKNIANSKKFRDYSLEPYSQTRISNSQKRIDSDKKLEIQNFIDQYL